MDRLKRFAVVVGENKDIDLNIPVIVEKLLHHEIEVFYHLKFRKPCLHCEI